MPAIKGFLETSFIDWPGCLCSVVFLGGCNFRCPFCHNHPLVLEPQSFETIPLAHVLTRLAAMRPWLGGVCVTGGEPTLAPDLPDLLRAFQEAGVPVKLDTNGTRPEVLENLLAEGLLAMIAMDVKAPLDQAKYEACAGVAVDLAAIRRSIALIKESGLPHQFRMTVVPRLHTEADVVAWRETVAGSPLKLQNFNPQSPLAPEFAEEQGFSPDAFAGLQSLLAR
ncbi:MAG TPA: anaerobic ribonucleoside-triphosphate reductase activating protein [Desulfurivibrionaceae bacterium]|nr:anaerobic ribonucleoside-triphosphate reductase activating protein [Desulfurivibrionaceae bacterium]